MLMPMPIAFQGLHTIDVRTREGDQADNESCRHQRFEASQRPAGRVANAALRLESTAQTIEQLLHELLRGLRASGMQL
jgi:hypothetical protein